MNSYSPHDLGNDRFAQMLARSIAPELLTSIAALSRNLFGWFSRRSTRADEYVWVVRKIGQGCSKTIMDIGAGVSPLPVHLARAGFEMITMDHSPIQRVMSRQQESDWNGWGFLDYAEIEPGIRSINQDVCQANIEANSIDCIYSVSVVEHFHSEVRRVLWKKAWEWMKPGADLLLTVDLVPNTSDLWNFEQGKQIEDAIAHGNCELLVEELKHAGLSLVEMMISRDYPDTPATDIALLHFKKA